MPALSRFYGEKERCASTPCSYSQELLLFNNELDPFNPVHNEAAWVRIHGDLDVAALVRALRYLVDRHTVLSSHFALAVTLCPSSLIVGTPICAYRAALTQWALGVCRVSRGRC